MKIRHKPNSIRNAILTSLVPAIGLAAAGPSQARETLLEEVIVTAQKRQESLQDVPIAVSAFQGQELTDSGIDTQRTLSMMTPNVAINVNANYVAPYIRAVGTQYANPGLEPSVATYFNDVYISRPMGGLIQFQDIERVEVLKGPQGTLYGRNSTGGAIRLITKDPTDEFEAGAGLTLGNYSRVGVDFYASGPLGESLKGRLSGQFDSRDGYIDNISGGRDMEERDYKFIHGKLQWDAAERLTVQLGVDYSDKKDTEGTAFQPLFPGAPEQVGAAFGGTVATEHDEYSGNVDEENEFKAGGAQLRVDYDLNTAILSSITGYRYTKFIGFADLDGTSAPLFDVSTVYDRTRSYSQEFQAISNNETRWSWTAGLYYYYEQAEDNFGLGGLFIDGSVGFSNAYIGGDGDIEVESIAPYGQVAYELTEKWELLFGLRYTDETKELPENDFYVTTQGADLLPNKPFLSVIPTPEREVSFQEWSPKLQVTWRPQASVMLYAAYQEGFKSGGFNMPSPSPNPVTEVDQENLKSYEIGWKTEFERVRFNGAAFHYKLEDLQLQVTDIGGGITSVRNAGDAEVDGIEFDVIYAATAYLNLGAGMGWQDAKFGSVPNGQYFVPCAQAPSYEARGFTRVSTTCSDLGGLGLAELQGELKGNYLPHAPEWSGYVRATYTQELGNAGSVDYNAVLHYADNYYYTSDNLYEEPSKTLVNANITWRSIDEHYVVSVFSTNLTDEDYNTHKAPFGPSGGWKVPGPPRLYGVRFGVNF